MLWICGKWGMRRNIWVCLRSSQFLCLEIQAFLDHSSIANVYWHLILNRMIYNLHKFLEIFFFGKKVWHHQSRDFQGCIPQILALEQTKKHLHQISCFLPVRKYHTRFFSQHPSLRWIAEKALLNKSWIFQWRQRIKWNFCTGIRGFTWEIKIITAQTLWNYNVCNSYLQKLVLYYFRGGGRKTFSEELLQI